MKHLILKYITFAFTILIILNPLKGLPNSHDHFVTGEQSQDVTYVCPMHPQVISAQPGKCPICKMTLVKQVSKKASPKKIIKRQSSEKNEPKVPVINEPQELLPTDTTIQPLREETIKEEKQTTQTGKTDVRVAGPPKTVKYDLIVKDTIVNYTGRNRKAIAINGTIPAPTLYFTEGDTAEIHVYNAMKEETSIHWHGIILPNTEDGVPYLTTAPIKPGKSRIFRFPIVQNGTYWYHSHTGVQEQSGMYGALIFYKREEPDIQQYPIVLSEWTDMRPREIHRSLHNQTDWFGIRKDAVQSYSEAISEGHFKTKLTNEWKRMLAMDVSDVSYDVFLINGEPAPIIPKPKKGDRVKLRVINGGASTYFWLSYAGGKMTVVANDGEDVQPVEVDRLIIAVAETYDVIVTIPDDNSYEFLVTPEDRTKHTSLWLGDGGKISADKLPRLKYFSGMQMMNDMMKMNGDMTGMEDMVMTNQTMDMNVVMYPEITGYDSQSAIETSKTHHHSGNDSLLHAGSADIVTLNYSMLKAPKKTTLPDWETRTFHFELTGNMNRYVWTLDNKALSESDNIFIKQGEIIRIIMFNNTMMRHPMHLHGHFFRVINGQGEYSPRKNVLDIMPMETDTIEFAATESGDWFFHCHILYHMMSGMGRVFTYENSPPNPELPNARYARRKLFQDDRKFHPMASISLETNGSDGEAMLANIRYKLETEWHIGLKPEQGLESETKLGRYFGKMQWLFPFIGYGYHYREIHQHSHDNLLRADNIFGNEEKSLFGQESEKENRSTFFGGIQYTLPLLFVSELRIDIEGRVRFGLMREDIPISPRTRFNIMINTDKEYMAGFRYIVTKYFAFSTHYDSDMGLGAGVTFTY